MFVGTATSNEGRVCWFNFGKPLEMHIIGLGHLSMLHGIQLAERILGGATLNTPSLYHTARDVPHAASLQGRETHGLANVSLSLCLGCCLKKNAPQTREWWNPASKRGAGPLHSMNVTRVQYIVR